jgi:hypothetical protein
MERTEIMNRSSVIICQQGLVKMRLYESTRTCVRGEVVAEPQALPYMGSNDDR